jgi:hypothetical protein
MERGCFFSPHFSSLFHTWSTVNGQNIFRLRRYLRGGDCGATAALRVPPLSLRSDRLEGFNNYLFHGFFNFDRVDR